MKGNKGLYCPMLEHDNCGIGAVVNIKGKKTHQVVSQALEIVENLEHRERTLRERPGTESGFYYRFPIVFSKRCA